VLRIGQEPLRFDIMNDIAGVNFDEWFAQRIVAEVNGVPVNFISLPDLKKNKKAAGRNRDFANLRLLAVNPLFMPKAQFDSCARTWFGYNRAMPDRSYSPFLLTCPRAGHASELAPRGT